MSSCCIVIIVPVEGGPSDTLGRAHDRYSCGNPLIEMAERVVRILLFVSSSISTFMGCSP